MAFDLHDLYPRFTYEEIVPESSSLEAVLNHDGDTAVNLGGAGNDALDVVSDPLGTVGGETSRGTEATEVVRCLVDGSNGPGSQVSAGLDEVKNSIDGIVGVVEVGGVVEEVVVHESLTNVEVVDTTGERVKADNDVHAVGVDGVVGDGLEVLLLVTVVKSGARNLDPCGVSCRDTESVDTNRGELINGRVVQEAGVTGLKGGATLVTKSLAERPLVGSGRQVGNASPPDRIVSLLLFQPTAEVSSVGLERALWEGQLA